MRRALFFAIIGIGGTAILLALGIWQMQRLAWKQGVIADIEARIDADPVALSDTVDPREDNYLPVRVSGVLRQEHLQVLVSQKQAGAGHRIIVPMERHDGSVVLVDLGFVAANGPAYRHTPPWRRTIIGNLQWPQETDSFTPEPDRATNTWFARDVPAMAATLNTAPVMIVAREVIPPLPVATPLPVDTSRIPNNHLQYAITWFSLAAIWLAMSLYFVARRKDKSEG